MANKDFQFNGFKTNGFVMLLLILLLLAVLPVMAVYRESLLWVGFLALLVAILLAFGFMMLEPNQARAMVFFGKYRGTFTQTGFYWVNPFITKKKISLRARNLNAAPIKVNDRAGNPIMIGLVMVWRIKDVYKALFEIDSQTMASGAAVAGRQGSPVVTMASKMRAFESFVEVQSDAALRQVAGLYCYDNNNIDEEDITLRSGGEEINRQLEEKLNERLSLAGIEAVEARINYLAYAPEIAAVMLRRQQADAIIAAREKIVEGAVTMVKMALNRLDSDGIVELDDDKKASMVSNLLVVLCADEAARPVVNTGTLHQ